MSEPWHPGAWEVFRQAFEKLEDIGIIPGRVIVCRSKLITLYRDKTSHVLCVDLNLMRLSEKVPPHRYPVLPDLYLVGKLWTADVWTDDRVKVPVCFPRAPVGCVGAIMEEKA